MPEAAKCRPRCSGAHRALHRPHPNHGYPQTARSPKPRRCAASAPSTAMGADHSCPCASGTGSALRSQCWCPPPESRLPAVTQAHGDDLGHRGLRCRACTAASGTLPVGTSRCSTPLRIRRRDCPWLPPPGRSRPGRARRRYQGWCATNSKKVMEPSPRANSFQVEPSAPQGRATGSARPAARCSPSSRNPQTTIFTIATPSIFAGLMAIIARHCRFQHGGHAGVMRVSHHQGGRQHWALA